MSPGSMRLPSYLGSEGSIGVRARVRGLEREFSWWRNLWLGDLRDGDARDGAAELVACLYVERGLSSVIGYAIDPSGSDPATGRVRLLEVPELWGLYTAPASDLDRAAVIRAALGALPYPVE